LRIEFPESLPVSGRRDEIMAAIQAHQVVIVCGETGSGKTTQLPKIALALGRGKLNAEPGKGRLIGHTQPRRIAASSVAKRIAEELKTPLGDVVGFKVRFQDRLSRDASVKLMTDGILLAETQTDPLLKAYDTLIIDEAHERSLNIDFLLGYLREILPRRPDLKVIVTSATIDADRFAQHFASAKGPAPTIMVSGRTFPVEQRYRPFEESREHDLNDAIADGVDELWRDPHNAGDILIFLPGEREIREAADHLRRHVSHQPLYRSAEVLPLFARLSGPEQDRIFESHNGRRIVLATNVAETSLTVPGIRYVIDTGTARVKRYSFRSKVEQLLVEPISQAAANQRAGRCGRVANGICIRLYDEKDFDGRPRFTDPEILRSSLAGVILRMKSLRLGDVARFPFLEAPSPRAIADGYQLLNELGAVDDANELTQTGAELSRLPLDPRVGRMILEARSRGALEEVLVIASALSVQDVRDRPMEAQQQADQAHSKFDDDKSEFSGYLRLWKWIADARGGHGDSHKLSNRQYEQLLRQNFINIRRVREWRDIHSQLLTVVTEHKWRINSEPAGYEPLHLSMLAGLLGNVGWKLEDDEAYLGARGIKFYKHPGAHLKKKPGRWIVAAELVETTRLFGRGVANIEPQWLEQIAGHLLKKQLLDPHWEKKGAQVSALERATLYGLVVYSGRRVDFTKVDPVAAREIFIREALVAGQWETRFAFLQANRKLVREVEGLEHKSRRQDVLVDDELIFAFYDAQLPADVASGITFEHWYRQATKDQPRLLFLTREELMRHQAAGITTQSFPATLRLGGVDCAATYLHEPGDAKDGLTVSVPLFVLNQVSEERCEWLVTGMLKDKIQALLKSLPQRPRSRLVPLPESASKLAEALSEPELFGTGSLTDVLLKRVRDMTSIDVKRADFKLDMLPPHLFMNLRVVDEHGRQLGMGRNLGALKAELGAQARGAFQALGGAEREGVAGEESSCIGQRRERWFEQRGEGSRQGRRRARAGRLAGRPALHGLDLRRAARADGGAPRFAIAHRLSGAARRGRCRDHRGVRRARGRSGQAPSGTAPPVRAAAEGRAQVPREEHPRPAEDVGGLHAAGHLRRTAHAGHRRGHRPRLPAGAVAHRRVRLQEAPGGGPWPPHLDRQRGGAAGLHHPGGVRGRRAQDQGHQDSTRCRAGRRAAVATPGGQALHRRCAMDAAAALCALPEGHRAAARQAACRPGPRRGQAGRAEAAGPALLAPGGRAKGCGGRAHARIPLASRRAARELLRAGAAHAAAGEREAAGQGVVAIAGLIAG
jgi:ATP-dependent helicase HrpA